MIVIIPIIKSHLGTDESSLPIQPIIDDLKDVIADSRILYKTINGFKAVWKKRILSCGNLIGVSIVSSPKASGTLFIIDIHIYILCGRVFFI